MCPPQGPMENAPVAASQGIATHGGCPAQIRSDDAIKQLDLVQGGTLDMLRPEKYRKCLVQTSSVQKHGWFLLCFPYWMRIPNDWIPIQPGPSQSSAPYRPPAAGHLVQRTQPLAPSMARCHQPEPLQSSRC